MTAAFDYRGAREAVFGSPIPGALKLLLLALVEWMPHCAPSVATLAQQCGVERKTILRALGRLERMSVLRVERSSGARSRYHLRPPADWKPGLSPVPDEWTGPEEVPVPQIVPGPETPPVPNETGTGTNGAPGPVPTRAPTGPILGPEAGRSRSESGSEAAHARALEAAGFPRSQPPAAVPGRTYSMPGEQPTDSYLGACTMAGVSPAQARSTWSHYVGKGLPVDGVERLEWWLVQRAKEKQEANARAPTSGRGEPAPDTPVDFDPRYLDAVHRDFCGRHNLDAEKLARQWRKTAVDSGRRYTRTEADRAFGEFIRKRARQAQGDHP